MIIESQEVGRVGYARRNHDYADQEAAEGMMEEVPAWRDGGLHGAFVASTTCGAQNNKKTHTVSSEVAGTATGTPPTSIITPLSHSPSFPQTHTSASVDGWSKDYVSCEDNSSTTTTTSLTGEDASSKSFAAGNTVQQKHGHPQEDIIMPRGGMAKTTSRTSTPDDGGHNVGENINGTEPTRISSTFLSSDSQYTESAIPNRMGSLPTGSSSHSKLDEQDVVRDVDDCIIGHDDHGSNKNNDSNSDGRMTTSSSSSSLSLLLPLDHPDRRHHKSLPPKLYAREKEAQQLLEAFDRRCTEMETTTTRRQQRVLPHRVCTAGRNDNTSIHDENNKAMNNNNSFHPFNNSSSSSSKNELVLVTGISGSGKTSLVKTVLKAKAIQHHGFFVSGKFDQLERPGEQYYPIVRAFTEYVRFVSNDSQVLASVQEDLRDMKESSSVLIDLIPHLSLLFGADDDDDDDDSTDDDSGSLSSTPSSAEDNNGGRSGETTMRPSHCRQTTRTRHSPPRHNSDNDRTKKSNTCINPQASSAKLPSSSTAAAATTTTTTTVTALTAETDITSTRLVDQIQNVGTKFVAAFRQFVSCLCSPERPIVLFLDDLQWAEPASLELVSALVKDGIMGLLIVGACRGNEVAMEHPLSVTLRELEADRVDITQVEVNNLDYSELTLMIADVLAQPVKQSKALVDLVWTRTKGNIFFVIQLLQSLKEEGLLYQSDDAWLLCYPADQIAERLPAFENALHLISGKLRRLQEHVQHVLTVAACLGCEFDEYLLRLIIGFDVASSLSCAEEKGLVVCLTWGSWRFVHDQIQQSCYNLIPSDEKESIHLSIGRKLWGSLTPDQLSVHSVLVVNQLRYGIRLVTDPDEREHISILLLRVGEKAMETSSYSAAAEYLDLGIQMLGNRNWRDQYELSLNLYGAAAEVHYCNGNFDRMDVLVSDILEHARCLDDKSRALMLSVYALGSRNELQKAIDRGLEILRYFDEPFPAKPSILTIFLELRKTKKILKNLSDADILSLPRMCEPSKLSAMRIMNLLFAYTLNGRPMYAPLIAFRLVQLSVVKGLSHMSCVAFSALGMLLCMVFKDVPRGVRYGRVALVIVDKYQAKEWLPRTYSAVYGLCFTCQEPFRNQLKPLLTSHRVGLGGDIEFSMLSAAMYTGLAISASVPLPQLLEDVTAFFGIMRVHKQHNMMQFLQPNMQFIKNMMGLCHDPCILKGDVLDVDLALKKATETQNGTIISVIHLNRLMTSSFFRQHKAAEEAAMDLSKAGMDGFGSFSTAAYLLHQGLVSMALADRNRWRRLGIARRNLKMLRRLAAHSKENYLNKVCLLEAEIASVSGRFHQSLLKYDESIALAQKEKLWSEAGLAAECAAYRLEQRGRRRETCEYLKTAISYYNKWGAEAKVVQLRWRFDEVAAFLSDDTSDLHCNA